MIFRNGQLVQDEPNKPINYPETFAIISFFILVLGGGAGGFIWLEDVMGILLGAGTGFMVSLFVYPLIETPKDSFRELGGMISSCALWGCAVWVGLVAVSFFGPIGIAILLAGLLIAGAVSASRKS